MNKQIGVLLATTLALGSTASMSGCASTTTITSNPDGASVRIDGQPVGNTPVSFTKGNVWVWTKHQINLQAPGYQDYNSLLNATVSPVHLVFGIICFFPLAPLVLVGQYKPRYHYEMLPQKRLTQVSDWSEEPSIDFSE